jgi:sulfur relay (sulfurtransferase) complex TusBCD TusD component (DsrE family)
MAGRSLSLLFVLATPAARGDLPRLTRLALAARARRLEVSVFLMAEAIVWAGDPALLPLLDDGCEIVCCATNLGAGEVLPGVVVGSQDDHAAMVLRADRVVSFT